MDAHALAHQKFVAVDDPLRAACRSLVQDLYDGAPGQPRPFPVSMSADMWPAWEGSPPESWRLRTKDELVSEIRSLIANPLYW